MIFDLEFKFIHMQAATTTNLFSERIPIYNAVDFLTSYNEDGLLGRGSFATVRKCHHSRLGDVVVKCFSASGSKTNYLNTVEEIAREANVLIRVKHKHIVLIYGIVTWTSGLGMAMEFIEGGSLEDLLMTDVVKDIPWDVRLKLASEMAEGISYLHYIDQKKAFVHGDLKPQNILLTPELVVKIADFGSVTIALATGVMDASLYVAPNTQHTPYYTAPEFLRDPEIKRTRSMDVYSTAMIEYEILTRWRVFKGVHPGVIIPLIIDRGQKPDEKRVDKVEKSLVDEEDLEIFHVLKNVMKQSWCTNPEDRVDILYVNYVLRIAFDKVSPGRLSRQIEEIKRQNMEFYQSKSTPAKVCLDKFSSPFVKISEPPETEIAHSNKIVEREVSNPGSRKVAAESDSKNNVSVNHSQDLNTEKQSIKSHVDIAHPSTAKKESPKAKANSGISFKPGHQQPDKKTKSDGKVNHVFKIVLFGDTYTGKTSIVKRFTKKGFDVQTSPTIGASFISKVIDIECKKVRLVIWDTGGLQLYHHLIPVYLTDVKGMILVYDISNKESFSTINQWLHLIKKHAGNVKVILLGNKNDLQDNRAVEWGEGETFAEENGWKFFETSAKKDINIDKAFRILVNDILNKINSSQSVVSAIAKSKPLPSHGEPSSIAQQKRRVATTSVELLKLVLIGAAYTGKTCIASRIVFDSFDLPHSADFPFGTKKLRVENKEVKLQIWNTSGQQRFRALIPTYTRLAHGIFLVYDITDPSSFESLPDWLYLTKESECKSIMLIGNKSDLYKARKVSKQQGQEFARNNGFKFFETSAKENVNIVDAYTTLATDILREVENSKNKHSTSTETKNCSIS